MNRFSRLKTSTNVASLWIGIAVVTGCTQSMNRAPVFDDPSAGSAPFSAAVKVGNELRLSGVIGSIGNALTPGGIAAETDQAFDNMLETLARHDLGLGDLTHCRVYLADIADFQAMNEIYVARLSAPRPARTTVGGLELVFGARIEIECIAALQQG